VRIVACLAALLALAGVAAAQSLLQDGTASPYDPPKTSPYKRHDHVQVVFAERVQGTGSMPGVLGEWMRFDRPSATAPVSAAQRAGNPPVESDARVRPAVVSRARGYDLGLTLTAEVIDIRPNGAIVLQAVKRRKVNDEEETIRITGEAAPAAVVDGQVRSERLANLSVATTGPVKP
jgi:hypothetical protein